MSSKAILYLNLCRLSCMALAHSSYRANKYGIFYIAIEHNCIDVVKYLIKNIDINLPNTVTLKGREYYYTPLMIASKFNRCKIIEILLNNGANIDYQMPRWLYTALHIAVKNNNITAVTILLSRGAKVDIKNSDGYTALHKAVIYRRRREIIKLLLSYNADIGIRVSQNKGYTPFDIVNQCYDYNTLELLTSHIIRLDKSNSKNRLSDGFKHNKEMIKKSRILKDIEKKCIVDMNKMKRVIIKKRYTLFDSFVNNNLNLIANYKRRNELKSIADELCIYKGLYNDFIDSCILRANLLHRSMNLIDNLYSKYYNNTKASWNNLPHEIKNDILTYLNNDELRRVSETSLL
ncbi:ankyrin repeat protein [Fowlpox virus]|nr:ankyrin repeat protein [Fowlpox virus]